MLQRSRFRCKSKLGPPGPPPAPPGEAVGHAHLRRRAGQAPHLQCQPDAQRGQLRGLCQHGAGAGTVMQPHNPPAHRMPRGCSRSHVAHMRARARTRKAGTGTRARRPARSLLDSTLERAALPMALVRCSRAPDCKLHLSLFSPLSSMAGPELLRATPHATCAPPNPASRASRTCMYPTCPCACISLCDRLSSTRIGRTGV